MDNASLKHQLLIAMPQMDDPNFEHTVTYVVEHGDDGAMGLTLNRPVSLSLLDILVDMDIEVEVPPSEQAMMGGPMVVRSSRMAKYFSATRFIFFASSSVSTGFPAGPDCLVTSVWPSILSA